MNYENNVLKRELHELSLSCAIPVLENSLSMIFGHLEDRCQERLLGEKSSKLRGLQAHTRRLITPWHSLVYVSSNAGQGSSDLSCTGFFTQHGALTRGFLESPMIVWRDWTLAYMGVSA